MRKTKIICTIGPASENAETLKKMCQAGMNVARLNFSHGTHEEQQNKINLIKQVRDELGVPLAPSTASALLKTARCTSPPVIPLPSR